MTRLIIFAALAAASAAAQEPETAQAPKIDEMWKCYALADFNHQNALVTATSFLANEESPLQLKVLEMGFQPGLLEVAGTEYRTMFSRQGFNRRWDFGGDDGNDYALVIAPDGDGAYYDFTREKEGVKPSSVYDCVQSRRRARP